MKAAAAQLTDSCRDLLGAYLAHVASLSLCANSVKTRARTARRFLEANPDLNSWMRKPVEARSVEVRRRGAHQFIEWCFIEGHLRPDLGFLMGHKPASLYVRWARRHAEQVTRVREAGQRIGWKPRWVDRVSVEALGLLSMWSGKSLDELSDDDLPAFFAALDDTPHVTAGVRTKMRARMFGLQQALYQLEICRVPPKEWHRDPWSVTDHFAAVPQPEIRAMMVRYVKTVSTTIAPATAKNKIQSLILLAEYLAAEHPKVRRLVELDREHHIEPFLIWNASRTYRGRKSHLAKPVSPLTAGRTVADVRIFFSDLALWGWAERPKRQLFFDTDIARRAEPLPRALAPDVDRELMHQIRSLDDTFARYGLILLRGTGLRVGELLDLELDCLWDTPSHGTWIKVPLGKLKTERMVPLDTATLEAFDGWMDVRGPQRPVPHPRDRRQTAFLFMERGRRLSVYRLHKGLRTAAAAAGLKSGDGTTLKVTPHQFRHTYGTTLLNAGMSLEALMALLGHVTPEMTLRYAKLAQPTIRAAYEKAMTKVKARTPLPLAMPVRGAVVPDRVEWLRSEMLKTRVAHGYCSRHLAADACPYANICEQCDNYVTAPEFLPALQEQLADVRALKNDAEARGWDAEVARHARVVARIEDHVARLRDGAG